MVNKKNVHEICHRLVRGYEGLCKSRETDHRALTKFYVLPKFQCAIQLYTPSEIASFSRYKKRIFNKQTCRRQ